MVETSGLIAAISATALLAGAGGWLVARRKPSASMTGSGASAAAAAPLASTGAVWLVWEPDGTSQTMLADPRHLSDLSRLTDVSAPTAAALAGWLRDRSEALASQIEALKQTGQPFATTLDLPAGSIPVIGGTTGPRAWVKLVVEPAGNQHLSDLDAAPVLAWRLDRAGRLIWANQAYLAAVEAHSVEQATSLASSVDADAAVALTGQRIAGRHSFISSGQRRSYEVIHQPLPDGVAGLAFDQTPQVERLSRIDREIRAHVETLNHLNDAVVVFDGAQELVFYNRAFARLWKLEDAWLNTRPTHGEWLDLLREKGRVAYGGEYRKWRTAELSVYEEAGGQIPDVLWRLPDGRILRHARQRQPGGGLLLLFEDISDTTTLKAQFQTQLEVQAATLDKLVEAVGVFAGDGRLKLANSAFCALWRVDPNILDTRPEFATIQDNAQGLCDGPEHWDDLRARICDPTPAARQDTSGRLDLRDGRVLSWRTRPLPDGATLVAWDDVTAAERYQEQLQLAADVAREADRLKTDFVRNIAYQLKNPLTPIKAYVELLLMGVAGPVGEAQLGYLKTVAASAGELEETINRLMQLALIEAGKMDLDIGDVHIPDALNSVAETVQSQLADAPVRIEVVCDPEVRLIRGDSARVRQMLYTLARQSLETLADRTDGVVRLIASARDAGIVLSVWDNGPAMPVDLQQTAFSQVDSNERRSGVSSVLVRRFAEMHGGWVSIRSDETAGTTVSVHLPLEPRTGHGQPELDLRAA